MPSPEAKRIIRMLNLINERFGADLTYDDLLKHNEECDLSTWRKYWPDSLEMPKVLSDDELTLSINRNQLFNFGESLSSKDDILEFYTKVCAWGAGSSAQQVWRCIRPLREPAAITKLEAVLLNQDLTNPVEFYQIFNNVEQSRIKYLGPAFFTKLMYFRLRNNAVADGGQIPLILDKRIADALGWRTTNNWSTPWYERYLEIMDEVEESVKSGLPRDFLEYLLFVRGRYVLGRLDA